MKASNKSSIITGVALLCLAALFSICLIAQAFDFGSAGTGHNNFLLFLGNMLYTVYGFSSILIPGFLLISGLSCFATQWTARKTMRLITALVPFFTCVITEKIIRSIVDLGGGAFAGLKIIIALVIGAMLIVIEFLGTGIIADKIQQGSRKKGNGYTKLSKISIPSATEEPAEGIKHRSIFDKVLDAVDNPSEENTEETEYEEDENLDLEAEEAYRQYNSEQTEEAENPYASYEEEIAAEEAMEEEKSLDSEIGDEEAETEPDDTETETPATSSSMITQEEFAALTSPEEPADELEWPDLPPQPEKLPPEYDADFDENDPDLEFPPKELVLEDEDEPESEENQTEEAESEDTASENETSPVHETYSKDDPYAAARYVDKVVENPRFPHGIVIHDYSEEEPAEEDKESDPKVQKKSKFPSRISLEDDAVSQSSPEPEISDEDDYVEDETLPLPDFDIETPAILKKEKMESEEENPFNTSIDEAFEEDDEDEDENPQENLKEFFNKMDSNSTVKPVEDPYEIENSKEEADEEVEESPVFNQIIQTEIDSDDEVEAESETEDTSVPEENDESEDKPEINEESPTEEKAQNSQVSISSSLSDVFSDMEEDIRKNQPVQEKRVEETKAETIPSKASENNPHAKSATNLTADELTDFFKAQQEENKPKGSEIMANPPKVSNIATKKGPYVIPSDLLIAYKDDEYWVIDDATKQAALNLKQTLAEFNIEAEIIGIKKGPVVTMFELLPAPGVKLSKIVALQDNIALSLAAQSVRIVAPIPGKQAVGIEVPNRHRSVVGFREIIEMDLPEWKKMAVPVILGKDILGKAQLIDLVKTPHMLIAGATGSGKSVCVNSLILSILYKRSFQDVKMILVDPKVVELKLYNNIPHLLTPVITEPKKALQALKWALCEMERRYALLDQMGVRDISNYNQKIKDQKICTEKLPYIVIIIDEFADLMATSGKELESVIARLTAMSRAVGIHLVLATQRPSVNVITGLIKANIPTRIAFMVASRTDSNIIIDTVGAEKLLGRGDMLYASAVDPAPVRIQGTFISDQEVEDVVRTVKEYGEPDYIDDEIFIDDEDDEEKARDLFGQPMDDDDPLYDQALEIVVQSGKASASYIQRRLKIGYNRAARLVEEMEERGIVGPQNGSKPREIIHVP